MPSLAALHRAYGGNAKAMEIISSAIQTDHAGDVAAYWQVNQDDLLIERALEDLVTQQFDRLQQLDSDAYNLLCRMGCYRYQDVPTVPIEGLYVLLWDVAENRRKRVVKALQERSLIDSEGGKYWLHPVIRSESISRLKPHEDWKIANNNAAEYCTRSVSSIECIEDALLALEAYHHRFQIDDVNAAFNVLTTGRQNQWNADNDQYGEPLVPSLYRLGLTQKILSAAINIIDLIEPGFTLAEMCNALGEIYYQTGQIKKAIEYHEKAVNIAKQFNDEYIVEIASGNLGLCKIELWELEDAFEFLQ